MKLVIDEKLKHRLVGISVILSLAAIFLPAMMKKSSQRLESNFSVNVQLPPKPVEPHVAVTDEEQMFKTVKVSKVEIPATPKEQSIAKSDEENFIASAPVDEDAVLPVAQIEPSPQSLEKPLELALNEAARNAVKKQINVATIKSITPAKVAVNAAKARVVAKPVLAKVTKQPAAKREIYAVQLASFSKLSNAQALVTKLQHKGYKANYSRVANRNRVIYKVYVGHSPIKNNVEKLKTQLASAMQLNGFVVNTGVS